VELVPEPGRASQAVPAGPDGVVHVVERGQTLWRIARTYEVPLDELARANGIADPARLSVGDRLLVPGASALRFVPPSLPPAVAGAWDWPVHGGAVLSGFGAPRGGRRHSGVDIAGRAGQPVLAVRDGRVLRSEAMGAYGRTVIVDHGDGLSSLYAHNADLLVRPGDLVRRGQPIARVGRTGRASTEHCHLEIRQGDVPVDPLPYLRSSPGSPR
jgi:murein DD-endopeptidase MepM/ murein hydrolase activator NlpD